MLPISVIQSFLNPQKLLVSLLICDNRFHMGLSVWNHFLILIWNAFPFCLFLFCYYKGQIKRLSPELSLIFHLSVDPSFSSWVKSCLDRTTTVTSLSSSIFFPWFLRYWLSHLKETLLNTSVLCHSFCSCVSVTSVLIYSGQNQMFFIDCTIIVAICIICLE